MRKTPRGWIQIGESRTRGVARIPLGLKPSRDSRATSQRDSPIWIQPLGVFRYRIMSNLHYNDVIMGAMTSQITSLTIVYSTVYSDNREFPAQMASNAKNASIWWRHHVTAAVHLWAGNFRQIQVCSCKIFCIPYRYVLNEVTTHVNCVYCT